MFARRSKTLLTRWCKTKGDHEKLEIFERKIARKIFLRPVYTINVAHSNAGKMKICTNRMENQPYWRLYKNQENGVVRTRLKSWRKKGQNCNGTEETTSGWTENVMEGCCGEGRSFGGCDCVRWISVQRGKVERLTCDSSGPSRIIKLKKKKKRVFRFMMM